MKIKSLSRFTLTTALLLAGLTLATGQKRESGYLVTTEGDSITGVLYIVRPQSGIPDQILQIDVVDPSGAKKAWEAKNIAEYALDQSGVTGYKTFDRYYAKVWPSNGQRVFINPMVEGKAHLYLVADPKGPKDLEPTTSNTVVFRSGQQDQEKNVYFISFADTEYIIRLESDNYVQVLKQFLKDCPELTAQIGKKKFKFKNLSQIVTYYNESCK